MVEKVIWSPQARDDLDNIYLSILEYSVKYATNWLERLFKSIELLEKFPKMGTMIKEKEIRFVREIFVGNHKVAYCFLNSQITILRIVYKGSAIGNL